MSNVLVTGGAGFIGSHSVDLLVAEGHRVRILDNLERPTHMTGAPQHLSLFTIIAHLLQVFNTL